MLIRCVRRALPSILTVAFMLQLPLSAPAQDRTLEEIVVTAQKREQSLQDVPISITALSGDMLDDLSVDGFYDVNIPGVNIQQGGMSDNAFIRGIGQSSGNFGFENSAPFYVDGMYYGKARATRLNFLDVQTVEVLKGPQPTYLGKNAIAGGINITSRRPTEEFEGMIEAAYEFEAAESSLFGVVSGPLTDDFRARLALKWRDMADGWIDNVAIQKSEPEQEDLMGRLSAAWDVSDTIDLYAKLEFADLQWDGRTTQQLLCLPGAPIVPELEDCVFNDTRAVDSDPTAYPLNFFSVANPPGTNFVNDLEQLGGQVQATWRGPAVEVVSVTSYFDYTNDHFAKADHNVLDRGVANFVEDFEQFSQEVRVTPSGDSKLDWLAGVYYDTNNNDDFTNIALPGMNMAIRRAAIEDQDSWAVFGEVAVPVGEEVTVKLGGRYSVIEKDYDFTAWIYSYVPNQDFASTATLATSFSFNDLSREDKKFQPSLIAEWRPTDEAMIYFSYKEGFKAGGFDHQPVTPNDEPPFEPEEAESFELGAKLDLLGGRARLNATLFSVDYTNLQVSTFTGTLGFRTTNAGESSTQGLELDGSFLLTDNLTLSAYLSFLSAEYDNYQDAQCYLNPPQTEAEGCVDGVQDLSGAELQFAPDYSGSLSLDYRAPLNDALEVFGRVDLFFTDDYQLDSDNDPDTRQSSYEKWDARFGIGSLDGRWEVAFIGRNLTDEYIRVFMGDTGVGGLSHFAILDRTRQYGVQGRVRF